MDLGIQCSVITSAFAWFDKQRSAAVDAECRLGFGVEVKLVDDAMYHWRKNDAEGGKEEQARIEPEQGDKHPARIGFR